MWRQGTKVAVNVYDNVGDPVCQCQTVGYAKTIVASVNHVIFAQNNPSQNMLRKNRAWDKLRNENAKVTTRIDELWNENKRLREEVRVAQLNLKEKEQHVRYLQKDISIYGETAKRHIVEFSRLTHDYRVLREANQADRLPYLQRKVSQNPIQNPPPEGTSNQPLTDSLANVPNHLKRDTSHWKTCNKCGTVNKRKEKIESCYLCGSSL